MFNDLKAYIIPIYLKQANVNVMIKHFCTLITFNYPIKACFMNKKYPISFQTRTTQIVSSLFLLKIWFLIGIFIFNYLSGLVQLLRVSRFEGIEILISQTHIFNL